MLCGLAVAVAHASPVLEPLAGLFYTDCAGLAVLLVTRPGLLRSLAWEHCKHFRRDSICWSVNHASSLAPPPLHEAPPPPVITA